MVNANASSGNSLEEGSSECIGGMVSTNTEQTFFFFFFWSIDVELMDGITL